MRPQADHGETTYEGTGRLEGRHALITGADSGIGRAVALAFAREGADVAISYLSEETDARETERLVAEAGQRALLLPGNIGESTICETVARKAIDAFGNVDILVNNAAFQRTYEKFEDIPDDEFEEAYRVNVFAMFRLCKAILPQMEEGGSIINTASIQSFDPSPNLIPARHRPHPYRLRSSSLRWRVVAGGEQPVGFDQGRLGVTLTLAALGLVHVSERIDVRE